MSGGQGSCSWSMMEPEFHPTSETKANVVSRHDTRTLCFYFELRFVRHRFMNWMGFEDHFNPHLPQCRSPHSHLQNSGVLVVFPGWNFVFCKMKKLGFIVPTNSTILWSFEYTQRIPYSERCDCKLKLERKSIMNQPLTPAARSSFPCLAPLKQQKIIYSFFHMAAPYK